MRRLLLVWITLELLASLPLFAQTPPSSQDNSTMLLEELLNSKVLLQKQDALIASLEQSLTEALKSQQGSEATLQASQDKISGLETSLAEARKQRDLLQTQVDSLQSQLTAVSSSLEQLKQTVKDNEAKQEQKIKDLVASFSLESTVQKVTIGVLAAVALGELVALLLKK